jgi:hypothetical protein
MKKAFQLFIAAIIIGLVGAGVVTAGQNPLQSYSAVNTSGYGAPQNLDAMGNTLVSTGTTSIEAASGVAFVVKATPGRIVAVNVISASGVGAIYNAATTGTAAATNQIAAIPATVGTYTFDWPASTGIVINPSSSVISVKYK